jgi:predicted ATPase
VVSRYYTALALWLLGFPDQALKGSQDALTLAHEGAHPYSLAFALTFAAVLHQYRREEHAARERAEATIALCTEQGIAPLLAMGTVLQGWARAKQGQRAEGVTQMRQSLAAWSTTGAEIARPHFLALLAEAYEGMGQAEEGLNALAEALAAANKTEERWYEAELYRLKGTLTLQSQAQALKSKVEEEAEECFWKAIEIARRQQAKSWELRAVMSLSRLWQQQGKKEEARQMLMEIYGWFTEGFDTADLQEAKVLLGELNRTT